MPLAGVFVALGFDPFAPPHDPPRTSLVGDGLPRLWCATRVTACCA
jgi:hypothetical protein